MLYESVYPSVRPHWSVSEIPHNAFDQNMYHSARNDQFASGNRLIFVHQGLYPLRLVDTFCFLCHLSHQALNICLKSMDKCRYLKNPSCIIYLISKLTHVCVPVFVAKTWLT